MCGRYELPNTPKSWAEVYDLLTLRGATPEVTRAEVRPTNTVPIVANDAPHALTPAKWWLEGVWCLPLKDGTAPKRLTLFNARADKLPGRFWKSMAETRRCVVPAASFYEWRKVAGSTAKQRVRIALRSGAPLLLAGLWNDWDGRKTFTVVTTEPNDVVRPIHDRMPVILSAEGARAWLAPEPVALDELQPLLVPSDPAALAAEDAEEPAKAA